MAATPTSKPHTLLHLFEHLLLEQQYHEIIHTYNYNTDSIPALSVAPHSVCSWWRSCWRRCELLLPSRSEVMHCSSCLGRFGRVASTAAAPRRSTTQRRAWSCALDPVVLLRSIPGRASRTVRAVVARWLGMVLLGGGLRGRLSLCTCTHFPLHKYASSHHF